MNPLTAIEILRAAVDRSDREPVKTRDVRRALMAVKPLCQTAEMVEWFWECAGGSNEIGRSQNVRAALNGLLRQVGLPTE